MAIKKWFGVAALMAAVGGAGAAMLAKSKEARQRAGATYTSAKGSTAKAAARVTGGRSARADNGPAEETPTEPGEPVQEKK